MVSVTLESKYVHKKYIYKKIKIKKSFINTFTKFCKSCSFFVKTTDKLR